MEGFDFDAPIENPPVCVDYQPSASDFDDYWQPEERISDLGPDFWNRILLPSPIDFDNKENIYEDLYANLGSPSDSCDVEEVQRGLADLELQKLPLRK